MPVIKSKGAAEALRTAGALSTVGLSFVLALVMGFWLGNRLDTWLHTTPVLTMVGFLLGLAAGVLNVFRTVSQAFPTGPAAPSQAESGASAKAPHPSPAQSDDDEEQRES